MSLNLNKYVSIYYKVITLSQGVLQRIFQNGSGSGGEEMHGVSLIEIVVDAFSITVFSFSMVMLFINNVLRRII